jgi:hypothetical protein
VWYEGPTSRKAVVTQDWHLVRNLVPDDTTELYDELHDPTEEHDLAGTGEPSEQELGGMLASWMDAAALPPDFKERVEGNVSTTPMKPQQPLGDVLAGSLVIEGVDVATPQPRPGGELDFSLILHATARPPEGYTLFTHVTGANGWRINADHQPLDGLFPLSRMKPGTWIRDRVRVPLPQNFPTGKLSVDVGLWRAPNNAPARGPHTTRDAVRVLELEVAR